MLSVPEISLQLFHYKVREYTYATPILDTGCIVDASLRSAFYHAKEQRKQLSCRNVLHMKRTKQVKG